jgi:DNA (cytosine-5)-methyltransferase 1
LLKVNEKTHLDLFSGIGGFALAAKWNGYRTVGFCDNEPYAQAVLKKHWPEVPCHKDIREVRGELYAGVTLLTGGFPCQPFSVAGKQRGKTDDRYLWPEMLRVIREAGPTWIVGENVAGIVNMALDQVHADLEAEGYEVESIIVPACAVDAPHRRDRVWIIARDMADTNGGQFSKCESERKSVQMSGESGERVSDVSNSQRTGLEGHGGVEGNDKERREEQGRHIGESGDGGWQPRQWLPEPNVGRVAHGVPNRVAKLRGLGNAIVPQVASEIIRCINKIMEDNK